MSVLPLRVSKLLLDNGWEKTWEDLRGQRWEKESDVHYWPYWKLIIDFMPDGNHYCELYHGSEAEWPESVFHLRNIKRVLRRRGLVK